MKELIIPFHLAIPVVLSLCCLIIMIFNIKRLMKNNKRKWFWISIIAFFLIYSIVVGSAIYDDLYYQWDLNRFDLNKDGFFGGSEITADQEAAMERLINDVGRNLSFLSGAIFSIVISTAIYFFGILFDKILKQSSIQKNP